jgi:hypothetical protein
MIKCNKAITTHQGLLIKTLLRSKGPVCEVGCGPFSTPLLHWVCKAMGRKLQTYENDKYYYDIFWKFRSRDHSIRFVENWDTMLFNGRWGRWGVVFIDHAPTDRRAIDAINFADKADFVVMHDSDATDINFDTVWPHYKYRLDWDVARPWSTVLSNTVDVTKWTKDYSDLK